MTRTVVHFVDSDTWGGCEEVVLLLLAGLDKSRWRPILFHHGAAGISLFVNAVSQLGIPCRVVPRGGGWSIGATLQQFVRELRAANATIFHAHLHWPLACRFGIMAAGLCRVPGIVATSHLGGPYSAAYSGLRFGCLQQRLLSRTVHRYIAVSKAVKLCLCQELQVPEPKICVVHNGIRVSHFDRAAVPKLGASLTESSERPVVLTVAQLQNEKGHMDLLEAAALVPQARFLLAGEGPERESLEERARKLGLESRVQFLGERRDIPELLSGCDLFVLPSLREGMSLTVLEAMAAGKPVIASDIAGMDEVVVDGKTGMLVTPRNPVALAGAIRKLLQDKALAVELGAAGKARATREFSSEAMVRGVTRIYGGLLASDY